MKATALSGSVIGLEGRREARGRGGKGGKNKRCYTGPEAIGN